MLDGGFGSSVLEYSAVHGLGLTVHPIAVSDQFMPHGDHAILIKENGLDADAVAARIRKVLTNAEQNHER